MERSLLIAIDDFSDTHIRLIRETIAGWATCQRLPSNPDAGDFLRLAETAEVVVGWPEPAWLLSSRTVKLLLLPSAGIDDYFGHGLQDKPQFRMCNARGVYSVGAAEHAVGMMLALARRFHVHIPQQRRKVFQRQPSESYAEISGSRACVAGLGAI